MSDLEVEADETTPFLRWERVALLVWCEECHAGEVTDIEPCCDTETGVPIRTVHAKRIAHAKLLLRQAPEIDGLLPMAVLTFQPDATDPDLLNVAAAFEPPLDHKDTENNPFSHQVAASTMLRVLRALTDTEDDDDGEASGV